MTCPDDKDVGQWNTNEDDCKCLSISSCTQMMTTDENLGDGHAWCPSLGHCYQYDAYGIKGIGSEQSFAAEPSDVDAHDDGDWQQMIVPTT